MLYQRGDEGFGGAGEEVDGTEFDHRFGAELTTLLHAESCTSTTGHHLAGKGRIIDSHVKLKTLIVGFARDA